MMYILSQEELDDLRRQIKDKIKLPSQAKLQEFCSYVADNFLVPRGWFKGKPWGCILTVNKDHEWYCDDCPAKDICPHEHKHWSK